MKRLRFFAYLLTFGILLLARMTSTYSQQSKSHEVSDFDKNGDLRWTTEKWDNSSVKYTQARRAIDNLIRKKQSASALAQTYHKTALENPRDAYSQFRWAYSTYRNYRNISEVKSPSLQQQQELYAVIQALRKSVSPQNYEYTRLRFLLEVERLPNAVPATIVDRLIIHNPQDNEVLYKSIVVLANSSVDNLRKALPIAEKLVQRGSNNANYYAALGSVRFLLWIQKGADKAHGEKAIAAYKRYLQLAPADARFRRDVQSRVEYIRKQLNK